MGKYGKAAIRAQELLTVNRKLEPVSAWNRAVNEVFPNSPLSREKSCPRGAFLGLCSDGLVSGVPSGEYTLSKDNRRYAREAVKLLRKAPSLADKPDEVWKEIMRGEAKSENSQMDVAISLWQAGAISKNDV
ncbi:DUF6979 family protein [Halomonas campaniensis]|uniref:Uncharacterized protein n=1 Tax=Halomonas campaniensis TaxID=213554 RepID=A0A246S0Z6_9GAMM|nr:hypothetical protein JI62_08990 [Halomonas campaniensis]